MSLRKPLAASAAVIAACAIAAPTANASSATIPTAAPPYWLQVTCPAWYGFTNPATGCAPWSVYWAAPALFAPYGF
jgi:hypothetical protein